MLPNYSNSKLLDCVMPRGTGKSMKLYPGS
uniref:Uncharacterized protein n=1 Tax=Rhizophora mucronata TaxID=61149 RepID=A0A2P2QAG3_RHIMU